MVPDSLYNVLLLVGLAVVTSIPRRSPFLVPIYLPFYHYATLCSRLGSKEINSNLMTVHYGVFSGVSGVFYLIIVGRCRVPVLLFMVMDTGPFNTPCDYLYNLVTTKCFWFSGMYVLSCFLTAYTDSSNVSADLFPFFQLSTALRAPCLQ